MEDIQRFQAKRRGLKSGVTKLLAKIDGAISSRLEDVHSEVVSESQQLSVSTAITQLEAKRGQITELDAQTLQLLFKPRTSWKQKFVTHLPIIQHWRNALPFSRNSLGRPIDHP